MSSACSASIETTRKRSGPASSAAIARSSGTLAAAAMAAEEDAFADRRDAQAPRIHLDSEFAQQALAVVVATRVVQGHAALIAGCERLVVLEFLR